MPDQINQQIGTSKRKNQNSGRDEWFLRRYGRGMETLGTRLKRAREAAGLSQLELAKRVGMAGQSGVEAIEAGRSKNPTKIYEIAKACGVSVEWLQGSSQQGGPKAKANELPPSIEIYDGADQIVDGSARHMIGDHQPQRLPEIDLRGGASYGGGKTDREWNVGGGQNGDVPVAFWGLPDSFVRRELGLQYGYADVLQVRGDSMDDGSAKGLASGDRVIIDRRDTDPRQGGIFAVFDGDGVIIKQVELLRGTDPERILCTSRNPAYRPIELVLDESVIIIGRVAAVISKR